MYQCIDLLNSQLPAHKQDALMESHLSTCTSNHVCCCCYCMYGTGFVFHQMRDRDPPHVDWIGWRAVYRMIFLALNLIQWNFQSLCVPARKFLKWLSPLPVGNNRFFDITRNLTLRPFKLSTMQEWHIARGWNGQLGQTNKDVHHSFRHQKADIGINSSPRMKPLKVGRLNLRLELGGLAIRHVFSATNVYAESRKSLLAM